MYIFGWKPLTIDVESGSIIGSLLMRLVRGDLWVRFVETVRIFSLLPWLFYTEIIPQQYHVQREEGGRLGLENQPCNRHGRDR